MKPAPLHEQMVPAVRRNKPITPTTVWSGQRGCGYRGQASGIDVGVVLAVYLHEAAFSREG